MEDLKDNKKNKYVSRGQALKQIEERVRQRVLAGDWPAGLLLPARRTLAAEFDVDLNTVQRALVPLLQDGTLTADRRGTFVTSRPSPSDVLDQSPRSSDRGNGANGGSPGPRQASIGIIAAPQAYDPDFPERMPGWAAFVVRAFEQVVTQQGAIVHFYDRWSSETRIWSPLRDTIAKAVADGQDGIAIVSVNDYPDLVQDIASSVDPEKIPSVIITCNPVPGPYVHVFYDSFQAAFDATEHLIQAGCDQLIFFAPQSTLWVQDRIAGAHAALLRAGLPANALRVYPTDPRPYDAVDSHQAAVDSGKAALMDGLLTPDPGCGTKLGVIAENDLAAIGLLEATGVTNGRPDFLLIGFDDSADARKFALSSMRPPLEAMGAEAAQLLTRVMAGDRSVKRVAINSHLIQRSSTQVQ